MVFEYQGEYSSQLKAIESIAAKLLLRQLATRPLHGELVDARQRRRPDVRLQAATDRRPRIACVG